MTINEKLKPCPFCGGKANIHQNEIDKRFYIDCAKPNVRRNHAVILSAKTEHTAITRWNRRFK